MAKEAETDIHVLKGWLESYASHTQGNRDLAERDRDYYDGHQWTSEELERLRQRGQPPTVDNVIKKQVDYIIGRIAAEKRDPVAQPLCNTPEEAAHAVTAALNYVATKSSMDLVRTSVAFDTLVYGHGGAVIRTERVGDRAEIKVEHVPWDRLAFDPHSRRCDFSDARWLAVTRWMDAAEARNEWPDVKFEPTQASGSGIGDTFDDKPLFGWVSRDRKRVNVCEMYFIQDGVWHRAVMHGDTWVEPPEPSKFLDADGNPVCPISMVVCYRERDLNTYGVVRNMISLQDQVNKSRSKMQHLMVSDQFMYTDGAIDDVETMKHQVARPDGAIRINGEIGTNFQFRGREVEVQQFASLMQDARAQLQAIGLNAAMTGDMGERASGTAVQLQSDAGAYELAAVRQALNLWELSVYRQVWGRIRYTWTAERMIRVTKDDASTEFLALNKQTTARQRVTEQGLPIPPELEGDPRLDMPYVENNVAELDVDLLLDTVAVSSSVQETQFQEMLTLSQSQPGMPFEVIMEFHPDPRLRKRVLDRMRGSPEQQEMEAQKAQQAAQVEQLLLQIKTDLDRSKTRENEAKAEQLLADRDKKLAEVQKLGVDAVVTAMGEDSNGPGTI